MPEVECEVRDMLLGCEGDDHDLTANALDLRRDLAQLREVLLARRSTEVPEEDEEERAAQQGAGGHRDAVRANQVEI